MFYKYIVFYFKNIEIYLEHMNLILKNYEIKRKFETLIQSQK